ARPADGGRELGGEETRTVARNFSHTPSFRCGVPPRIPAESSPDDQYTVEVMALQALPERPRRQNFSLSVIPTMVAPGRTVVWQERTFSSTPEAVRMVTSHVRQSAFQQNPPIEIG